MAALAATLAAFSSPAGAFSLGAPICEVNTLPLVEMSSTLASPPPSGWVLQSRAWYQPGQPQILRIRNSVDAQRRVRGVLIWAKTGQFTGGVEWDQAAAYWQTLQSDPGAKFDTVVELDASQIVPQVTWGTSPEMVLGIDGRVPDPDKEKDASKRDAIERALAYMALAPGKPISDISIDKVFIGSCTNSRIEDMREAAALVKKLGRKVAGNVKLAMVVPGSGLVKAQAEKEGLHEIFKAAGFEWREPGCSMCLAMNADRLEPGERCASTSNRNFEGRQGAGGRTHLVSPAMAAAAAVHGHFVDIRPFA